MEFRQLEYFLCLAGCGSFSQAAAALHIAQPTLSRQISLLEADLGERLLERTGRGVVLTEAGRAMLVHAGAIVDTAARARDEIDELRRSPAGRISVGLPPRIASSIAGSFVARFMERLPRAIISIVEGNSLHLRELMLSGKLDLALLFDPPASPLLEYTLLKNEAFRFVAPPGTPDWTGSPVSLRDLGGYPLILPGAPNAIRGLIDVAVQNEGITLNVVAEVSVVDTILSLVGQGLGCTVMPESALCAANTPAALKTAAIAPPGLRNRLVIARTKARTSTRVLRDTAALLKELLPGDPDRAEPAA